ncbi:MAG: phosphate uptake regulator PhoU [Promethearchaeota archaeon]|nr:MAG: phosphate uptake regulator PhoU [Candidatus Lokiarchaeota archaeon]
MSYNIETRKVQQTGGSSYIVSLPKEWIDRHGIQAKDTIGILPQPDGNLMITPYINSQQYIKEKSFDLDEINSSDFLFRLLIGAYIMGYSIIKIKSSKKFHHQMRSTIESFINVAMGPEIIEETSNTILIKDLLDPKEMPFNKTIKRMYILAQNMHEDAVRALEKGDKDLAEQVINRDDQIDRLNWLVERQAHIVLRDIMLCQKMNITLEDASNYQLISRFLERIADHAVKIAKSVLRIDFEKIDKILLNNITKLSKMSLDLLNLSLDAWLQRSLNLANKNIESIENLISECEKIEFNTDHNPEFAIEIGYIIESIRRTGEYSSDISEIIINNLI